MAPPRVVPAFDEVEDGEAGVDLTTEAMPIDASRGLLRHYSPRVDDAQEVACEEE